MKGKYRISTWPVPSKTLLSCDIVVHYLPSYLGLMTVVTALL